MTFYTGVDQPACPRLKSSLQKATEMFDKRALRSLKLNRPRDSAGSSRPHEPRRSKHLLPGEHPPPPPPKAEAAVEARRAAQADEQHARAATSQPAPVNALAKPVPTVPPKGYFGSPASTLPVTNVSYSNPDLGGGGADGALPAPARSFPSSGSTTDVVTDLSAPAVSSDSTALKAGARHGAPSPKRSGTAAAPESSASLSSNPEAQVPLLEKKSTSAWLQESLYVSKQAEGHATFTHDLRRRSNLMNKETDQRAKKTRVNTNTELRSKVRGVQKMKQRVEDALNEASEEHQLLGQVRHFIIELKAMVEAGAVTGVEMRMGLRDSRPASERTDDVPDRCLCEERAHHLHTVDVLQAVITEAQAHLDDMGAVISDLYDDLEDKVEGLRIDEQCLVLDGSSSVNPSMGGSAAHQPPLDLMLDQKAKEVIQGLETMAAKLPNMRPPTEHLLDAASSLLTKSLALRREWKRKTSCLDLQGRRLNEKVEQTLKHKVQMEGKVIAQLMSRASAIQSERAHLEAQMDVVREELEHKSKEKDIVCKRLRLRCQIPGRDVDDKVHEALEEEYDFLTQAVQDYASKLSLITLEISRIHDSKKALEESLATKRTAYNIDRQCLDLPFLHTHQWPAQLYNGICSKHCSVYGCAPTEPPRIDRHTQQHRKLVQQRKHA